MAVVIESSPSEVVSAYECVSWSLRLDSLGTGNIKRFIGYKLVAETGEDITSLESINPVTTAEIFELNFSDDVIAQVVTMIPTNLGTAPGITNDTFFIKGFKLRYGVISLNTDTNEIDITDVSHDTTIVKVINSVFQSIEPKITSLAQKMWLTHQPSYIDQCIDARNFAWLFGTKSLTFKSSNAESINISAPFPVNYIPLHPYGIFASPGTLKWMQVWDASNLVFTINFVNCDCNRSNKNIMFLDPLGGRSMMSFEETIDFSMQSDFKIIDSYKSCTSGTANPSDNNTKLTAGGRSIYDKINDNKITLIREAKNDEENRAWFRAFLGSAGYHLQRVDDGDIRLEKFIIDSGTTAYNADSDSIIMSITGYVSYGYRAHKIDR